MIKGIYTAGRSLDQKIKNIDIIANNLANINTTGFKREIPFSEMVNEAGEATMRKLTSHQQGDIVQTSNPLDLAINGNGFFAVKNSDGNVEMTRDGRFKISDDGFLVDTNKKKVMGKHGPIEIEDTLLSKDSQIFVTKDGEIKIGERLVDKLMIVNVDDANELLRVGSSNFKAENQDYFEASEGSFSISQGFLEEGNSNPIVEMEAMIQLNKMYESAQKVIAALDASLGHANEIGKI